MSRILSRLSAPLARKETLIIRRCSASLFILSGVICSAVTENMAGTEARVVCIAVDGSEHSEKAFDWYRKEIYHQGDRLIVVHSHELHPPALPHAMATEEWKKEVQKHEKYIKDLEEKFKSKCEQMKVSAKIIVQGGHPGEHVCKVAKKEGAALIVCGSRGMGTVRRTILGSTSDYIIHHAHVPVVVVPKQ